MLITQSGFNLFKEYNLGANLRQFTSNLQKDIESDLSVKNVSGEDYVADKIKKSTISELTLHVDKISVKQIEADIPGRFFPSGFWVEQHESFPKPVFIFHIPFDGDRDLFRCHPSTFMMWSEEVTISNNEVVFEIINFKDDPELIKKERDDFVSKLENQVLNINNEIKTYNSKLEENIRTFYKKAKEKFDKQSDILSQLGNSPRD